MKGLLQHKSAWNQFLLLICITLVSFFVIGLVGTLAITAFSGVSIKELADIGKMDLSIPSNLNFVRALQVIQFVALFLVPSVIAAKLFSLNERKYLGIRKPYHWLYFLGGILVITLALPLTNLLGELNKDVQFPRGIETWMKNAEEEATRTMRSLLSQRSVTDLVINIICIAGLAAIGEELLFRGVVQRLLIKMFRNVWIGIIISAILFSALHMQFYGFLPRFMLGVLLGALYWYSGSLWVPILTHFFYDASLIVIAFFNPEMLNDETPVPMRGFVILGIIGLILIILIFKWMKSASRSSYDEIYRAEVEKEHPF
jgi:uncharacterized protein